MWGCCAWGTHLVHLHAFAHARLAHRTTSSTMSVNRKQGGSSGLRRWRSSGSAA